MKLKKNCNNIGENQRAAMKIHKIKTEQRQSKTINENENQRHQ